MQFFRHLQLELEKRDIHIGMAILAYRTFIIIVLTWFVNQTHWGCQTKHILKPCVEPIPPHSK